MMRSSPRPGDKLVKILDRQLGTIGVSTTTCSDNVTLIALNHTDTSLQALTHIAEHESHLNRCEVSGLIKDQSNGYVQKDTYLCRLERITRYGPWKLSDLGCKSCNSGRNQRRYLCLGQIVARLQNRWIP